jgi:hypothetical protein
MAQRLPPGPGIVQCRRRNGARKWSVVHTSFGRLPPRPAQTVYTCMYMTKPSVTSSRELFAYCVGVHKCIAVAQNVCMGLGTRSPSPIPFSWTAPTAIVTPLHYPPSAAQVLFKGAS